MTRTLLSLLLLVMLHSSSPIIARPLSRSALSDSDKAAIIQLAIELVVEMGDEESRASSHVVGIHDRF
jgi:hypothetical protein